MCLILFAFDSSPDNALALSANRDEFFSRPSAAAQFWDDHTNVLAGQDLVSGGTWLGITRSGRFAAVTNIREPDIVVENPLSRGNLTRDFLTGTQSCETYLESIQDQQNSYSGFNLLVGEMNNSNRELLYFSNRREGVTRLHSGIYGLSNHVLDSGWPKVNAGKAHLQKTLKSGASEAQHKELRDFLENPSLANDDELPKTGVSYEREKALSAAFIHLPNYGTRTSTVLTINNGATLFSERNYFNADNQQDKSDKKSQFFRW